MTRQSKLALIAGRGTLPAVVAAALDQPPLVCALEGHAPEGLTPDLSFPIERLGGLLTRLRRYGVAEICFCGPVDRPKLSLWRLDIRSLALVPFMRRVTKGAGEDTALRAVLSVFEAKGFVVRGAHDLVPRLLPPEGVLTNATPPACIAENLTVAQEVLHEQGRLDKGQSCVIRAGVVMAQEDSRGTDAMLRDLTSMPKSRGGVFFKAPKPNQDMRVDLPTIGPVTARGAVLAGLDGIVIAKGGVMVLERARVLDILEEAGLFLWVR